MVSSVAYIGLGSNLLQPAEQINAGVEALRALAKTSVECCSSFYRSRALGNIDQPDFINAVCRIATDFSALQLMDQLLDIECANGRVRGATHGGPRTLDLDLLLFDRLSMQSQVLTLPHPRMHERAFVLYPLYEIDPQLIIPGYGAIVDLMKSCASQVIERLATGGSWSPSAINFG